MSRSSRPSCWKVNLITSGVFIVQDFEYAISMENCREFCKLFEKTFDKNTRIVYQEIVKVVTAHERGYIPSLLICSGMPVCCSIPHVGRYLMFWCPP